MKKAFDYSINEREGHKRFLAYHHALQTYFVTRLYYPPDNQWSLVSDHLGWHGVAPLEKDMAIKLERILTAGTHPLRAAAALANELPPEMFRTLEGEEPEGSDPLRPEPSLTSLSQENGNGRRKS